MKKLLIALVFLVVMVGGVLVLAVVNANSIAQKYKPDMETLASDALGSTVTLGSISASVFPTAKLVVDEVKVESGGETLTLDNLTLKVALLPLLSKNLNIQTLELDGPTITVYMEEDGMFIAGLPRAEPSTATTTAPATTTTTPKSATATQPAELPIDVSLDNLELRNASITIIDNIAGAEYVVSDLNVQTTIALENNVAQLSALDGGAVLLDDVALSFNGKNVTYDLGDGAIGIQTMSASALGNTFVLAGNLDPADTGQAMRLSSDRVDLASLTPLYDVFAPGLNDLGLAGDARADLSTVWADDGTFATSGDVVLSNASWAVAEIPMTDIGGTLELGMDASGLTAGTSDMKGMVRDSPFTLAVTSGVDEMNAALETLTIGAFEGTAKLDTEILLEGDMPFASGLDISGMQLEPIVLVLLPDTPMGITGTLQTAKGNIEGTFNEDLMPSITGTAEMALVDGLIKDVNLGQQVLGAVTEIPFISGTLLNAVPPSLQALLSKDHTVLDSVTGSFVLANETMTTDNLRVNSDFFMLESKGTIGFDTNLNLESTIYFSKDFSAGMVSQVDQLSVLLDSEGRLVFPLHVSGIAPELKVVPDVSQLLERAIKGTVKKEAEKLIGESLGLDSTGSTEDAVDSVVEDAVDEVLDEQVDDTLKGAVKGLLKGLRKKKP